MDLSTRCPQCGRKHIYFSHEVGTEAPCRACGQAIELRPQKSVETIRITIAVVVVLIVLFCGGFSLMGRKRPLWQRLPFGNPPVHISTAPDE
jgi:uncharacterized protein (DUF983 family)